MILQGRLLIDARRAPEPGWLRVADGRIAELGEGEPPAPAAAGGPSAILCPGFVDAHVHLPQIDARGCDGMDLFRWLRAVVFPAEMLWRDPGFAARQTIDAYRRLLRVGTLGYGGYLTSHAHGVAAVIQAGEAVPLRGVVGQVLMDRNAPDELIGQAIAQPPHAAGSRHGRLDLSVNPRFAVSCTDALLTKAATLASTGAFVATHLAESREECDLVRSLFPDHPSDTAVYDHHGLLTERTLLAHCVHMTDAQWRLIADRRSVAVHCPTANTFLAAGLFDLEAIRTHDVRLALGSDVAAGPDLAMPRVGRAMIEVAKVRAMTGASVHVPTPADSWELITRGNAEALGFTDGGRLAVGAAADLLVLEPPFEVDQHLIGRLIYTWEDEYIVARVVNGRLL